MPAIIPAIIISYLLGAIPTAYLFGRFLKGIDIRQHGSGNVGATNAFRVMGKTAGIAVLALDIFKGFLAVVFLADLALWQTHQLPEIPLRLLLGLICISGHNWTVFLQFKGGKGVATTLGVLLGLAVKIISLRIIFGLVVVTWLVVFLATRIISIASILSAITLPIYIFLFKQPKILTFCGIILALFILIRHIPNLKRIFQGKERRIF